jgi:hypothetical protein
MGLIDMPLSFRLGMHVQVYHPNIDLEGNVCLNILREDWNPVLSVNSILYGLQYLFLVILTFPSLHCFTNALLCLGMLYVIVSYFLSDTHKVMTTLYCVKFDLI